jgi:hypothetical protein
MINAAKGHLRWSQVYAPSRHGWQGFAQDKKNPAPSKTDHGLLCIEAWVRSYDLIRPTIRAPMMATLDTQGHTDGSDSIRLL